MSISNFQYKELLAQNDQLKMQLMEVGAFVRLYNKAWQSDLFGLLLLDQTGRIVKVNPHSERLLLRNKEELLGRLFTNMIRIAEEAEFIECLNKATENKDALVDMVCHLIGGSRTIYLTIDLVTCEGVECKYLLLLRNISEFQNYSDEIKNKEYYLNMAQHIAHLGHYYLEIPDKKWTCSKELEEILGIEKVLYHSEEEWVGIIHPDDRQMIVDYFMHEVLLMHQPFNKEYRIIRPCDGICRWVYGKGELRYNDKGEPVILIGTIQDVTDQKQFEAELNSSRASYHDLVETSQDLMWQWDEQGRFIFLNQAWEHILGYDINQMLGMYYNDFLQPQHTESGKRMFDKLLQEGSLRGYETCFVNKKGEPVFLIFNAKRVVDEHGRIIGARGTAYDFTERHKSEVLLKEKSEELNHFFNTALDMLCVADIDGNFIRLNPEWKNVLGFELEELLGTNFLTLVHPEDEEGTYEAINLLRKRQAIYNFVNRYRAKDGTYKYIEWRSTMAGNMIFAAARDITERIEIEESLRLINKEMQESNAQKDKFLYIIAHDLRNPLGSILGFTDLLTENYSGYSLDELGRLLNMLNDSTHALYELIENLLNWALSKTGRIVVQADHVALHRLSLVVINQLHSMAYTKDVELLNNIPESACAWGDNAMMTTVLRNLISNAIKFSHPGSSILLNYYLEHDCAVVEIKDQGVGIDPELISMLFWAEEIYSTSGTKGERGTGLGLPLCKELMEKQDGHIWVESMPGKGSSFFISLPLKAL